MYVGPAELTGGMGMSRDGFKRDVLQVRVTIADQDDLRLRVSQVALPQRTPEVRRQTFMDENDGGGHSLV